MSLRVLRTVQEVLRYTEEMRRAERSVALVPTMGFLHEGHLSLMREAKRRADAAAVSIFVNPTQFGPREDLERYPRDEQGDLAKCEAIGVEVVFAPAATEIYPVGYQTYVEVEELSRGLCGARRRGHFRGVATVVAKLFTLFRPRVAIFGEKDYQQLQIIRALNRDLHLGADVIGMPIVREADGLAMSSRNAYLTPDQRNRATALWRGLLAARHLAESGVLKASSLKEVARGELEAAQVQEDYVEVTDANSLEPLAELFPQSSARLLVAAFVGPTRLIDNIALRG